MWIESTEKPVRYRLRDGREILLRPGAPAEVPDEVARQLLAKAAGKVRLVSTAPVPDSLVGHAVTWTSPLFGLLSAVVLADHGQTVTVWHPLTDREATIPTAWLEGERAR